MVRRGLVFAGCSLLGYPVWATEVRFSHVPLFTTSFNSVIGCDPGTNVYQTDLGVIGQCPMDGVFVCPDVGNSFCAAFAVNMQYEPAVAVFTVADAQVVGWAVIAAWAGAWILRRFLARIVTHY